MSTKPLNRKQLKFVAGVIAGLSAFDAYVEAGYSGKGKLGRNAASQLLANVGVQGAVQAYRARAAAATGVTAEWSLAYLKVLALYDGPRSSQPVLSRCFLPVLAYGHRGRSRAPDVRVAGFQRDTVSPTHSKMPGATARTC